MKWPIMWMKKSKRLRMKDNFLLGLIFSFLLLNACHEPHAEKPKSTAIPPSSESLNNVAFLRDSCKQFLQNGCIVLRTGNDAISSMFAQLNKTDRTFSHCGIAFQEEGQWYVYHSIGGEDNPDAKLRRDHYEKFVSRNHNLGFGICKYPLKPQEIEQLNRIVLEFYHQEIPFDMDFSLKSNNRFYCAEMVYKSFHKALQVDTFFQTTKHAGFEYVSTDNLFVNEKASMLCHVIYP